MLEKQYLAPCRIVSFTVSLLWALSYARFQLKEGATSVELYLVDTLELPRDVRIVSAANIAKFLHIKPQGVHWHDDPYHEYLLFGCLPRDDNAIVGRINFQGIHPGFNALVPGFDCRLREGLHASLDRFRMTWEGLFACLATGAEISANDISIARQVVDELIPPIEDKDVHFRITMMFLSLRKRKWDQGGFQKLRDAFAGKWFFRLYLFWTFAYLHLRCSNPVDVPVYVEGLNHSPQDGGPGRVG